MGKFTRNLLGGGLFALFVCLLLAALAASGVIDMMITHILLLTAWFVAVLGAFTSECLADKRPKHTAIVTILIAFPLAIALFLADSWLSKEKARQDQGAMNALAQHERPRLIPPVFATEKTRTPQPTKPSIAIRGSRNVVSTGPITQTGKNNIAQLGNNNQATIEVDPDPNKPLVSYAYGGRRFSVGVGSINTDDGEMDAFDGLTATYDSGKWGLAIELSQKLLKKEPQWFTPYYIAALSYAKLCQRAKAEESLAEFLNKVAGNTRYEPALTDAKQKLSQLQANIPLSDCH